MHKGIRKFADDASTRRLPREERTEVVAAFRAYLDTIPQSKRFDRELFYELRDVVGKSGFGIGSAGLPAYNVLLEGYSQALDNDVVLSMKQANIPAVGRFVDTSDVDAYFDHEGHRTSVSQRALQVHADPLLGLHARSGGVGYVVAEVSPYEADLGLGGRSTRPRRWRCRASSCSAGRRRRSTARPTRTATRTLASTSRPRRRSPTSLEEPPRTSYVAWLGVTSGASTYAERVRQGPRAVRRRLPRGPGRHRRHLTPAGCRRLRRRCWTCRGSARRRRRRAARPRRGRRSSSAVSSTSSGADVLLEVARPAWCRGSGTMSSPCASTQASASWPGVQPLRGGDLAAPRPPASRLASKFSPWKRGLRAAEVAVGRGRRRCDGAGQEAAAERAVGHEADAELAAACGRISSSRSRVHSEYSVCSAVIGCTACGAADGVGAASDSPR